MVFDERLFQIFCSNNHNCRMEFQNLCEQVIFLLLFFFFPYPTTKPSVGFPFSNREIKLLQRKGNKLKFRIY